MATWAQEQRYAWIDQALADGQSFTRQDLVEKFYITKQTATATLNEYRAAHPGKLAFDKAAKVFVRDGQPKRPVGVSAREAMLVAAMREACDLLAERTHGSPARSAGHNARLVLETAMTRAEGRPQ